VESILFGIDMLYCYGIKITKLEISAKTGHDESVRMYVLEIVSILKTYIGHVGCLLIDSGKLPKGKRSGDCVWFWISRDSITLF